MIVFAVAIAACSPRSQEPLATPVAAPRTSTFAPVFVDTIDNQPATHVAVGGKVRVRVADPVTATNAYGPFAIATTGDTVVITATGAGTGWIELETATGYAKFAMSAASISSVGLVESPCGSYAMVVLRDGRGKRLVDATLRVAPGSAPVTFVRDQWDLVELAAPVGAVLVKTDLLDATAAPRVIDQS